MLCGSRQKTNNRGSRCRVIEDSNKLEEKKFIKLKLKLIEKT